MTMRYTGGNYYARYRVPDQFEDALKAGKQSDWYDDALFYYAEWMSNYGTIRRSKTASGRKQPDYEKHWSFTAVCCASFPKVRLVITIRPANRSKTSLNHRSSIGVSNIFLPDSELQFVLNARNVRRVDFALYKFDMTRDVRFISVS